MVRPRGWLVVDCLTALKRVEHTLNHQVGPAETRVPPRDVIGVDDLCIRYGTSQPLGKRRLPATTPAVDRDNPRTTDDPPACLEEHRDQFRQRSHTPRASDSLVLGPRCRLAGSVSPNPRR